MRVPLEWSGGEERFAFNLLEGFEDSRRRYQTLDVGIRLSEVIHVNIKLSDVVCMSLGESMHTEGLMVESIYYESIELCACLEGTCYWLWHQSQMELVTGCFSFNRSSQISMMLLTKSNTCICFEKEMLFMLSHLHTNILKRKKEKGHPRHTRCLLHTLDQFDQLFLPTTYKEI